MYVSLYKRRFVLTQESGHYRGLFSRIPLSDRVVTRNSEVHGVDKCPSRTLPSHFPTLSPSLPYPPLTVSPLPTPPFPFISLPTPSRPSLPFLPLPTIHNPFLSFPPCLPLPLQRLRSLGSAIAPPAGPVRQTHFVQFTVQNLQIS